MVARRVKRTAMKIELRRVTPVILAKMKRALKIETLIPVLMILSLFFWKISRNI